jgi:hypothetical protein
VVGSCKKSNGPSDCTKGRSFLDQVSDYQLFKPASWSYNTSASQPEDECNGLFQSIN